MLPLIPLAISIAPEIAKWLFGDKAEKTTAAVAQAVQVVTGVDVNAPNGAAAAQAALAGKPELAVQMRTQLAQIAAAAEADAHKTELDQLQAMLADTASARAQTVALALAKSPIAFGAPLVSVVVLVTFAIVMTVAITRTMPSGSETVLTMLLGSLAAMATSVVSYWVGSSAGSARKDEHFARIVAGRDASSSVGSSAGS
jgi:hypothetical protein